MKKSIFIAVLGMASAVASYGQGQINFGNYYAYDQTTGVMYATGASGGANAGLFAGSEVSAILFSGASTDTLFSQLTAVPGSTTPIGAFGAAVPSANTTGGAGIMVNKRQKEKRNSIG